MTYQPTVLVSDGILTAFTYDYDEGAFGLILVYTKATGDAVYTLKTDGVDYSLNRSTNTVTFGSAPATGLVKIARDTPDVRATNYQAGSTLDDVTADNDILQAFYRIDELEFGLSGCMQLDETGTFWDAKGYVISNLGWPVSANDAVPLGYLYAYLAGGGILVPINGQGEWSFLGDGVTTNFPLPGSFGHVAKDFHVHIEADYQTSGGASPAYTVTTSPDSDTPDELVFGTAPPNGYVIEVKIPSGTAIVSGTNVVLDGNANLLDGSVGVAKLEAGPNGLFIKSNGSICGWAAITVPDIAGLGIFLSTLTLDSFSAATGSVDFGNNWGINVAPGVNSNDIATVGQLANAGKKTKSGLVSWTGTPVSWTAIINFPFTVTQLSLYFTGNIGGAVATHATFVFHGDGTSVDSPAGGLSISATRLFVAGLWRVTLTTSAGTGSLTGVGNNPYHGAEGDA